MEDINFTLSESKIAIIGLGLMGGSLALGLRGKCAALYGIDPHPATLELALSQHIVDYADSDPATLPADVDVVILSAPVQSIITLIDQLPITIPHPCIVMDLGSTKRLVVEAMAKLPERFDPIGGHPICGKEKLSLANAERTLYYAAPFLLTPLDRTSPRAISAAYQIIEALGAKGKTLDAVDHDRILASTSHLPFLISSALARTTPEDVAPFVGPGFKSTSRLAGTSSSMMLGVLQSNRENVLNALRGMQSQLAEIESALSSEDFTKLESLLNESQSAYHSLTVH
ncbi:MAG: prephenate dehydrogenase/arogenate dehydrogenase family protein [Anaerolineales bacterium]|jgi:prephenate dehydrogenase|nr:prephenate dehydrogenase/arogenate dehydrogenase family protein [Chloroflexota bacterium]MBK6645924.1 prephenate dehydrogenase/arogenate dehydrogenase family protein [Anaerolineales bacterium]